MLEWKCIDHPLPSPSSIEQPCSSRSALPSLQQPWLAMCAIAALSRTCSRLNSCDACCGEQWVDSATMTRRMLRRRRLRRSDLERRPGLVAG